MARLLAWSNAHFPEQWMFLFGPNTERDLCELHNDVRVEMLLDPPPGSPRYRQTLGPWKGLLTPLRNWRGGEMAEATMREMQEICIVRQIQEYIRQAVPQGETMTCHHAVSVLRRYGKGWYQVMPHLRIAVDNMNQDAPRLG